MKTNGPQKVTVKEFASIADVDRQSIYKAGKRETINIKKGLIDLSDIKTIDYLQAAKIRRELKNEAQKETVSTKTKKKQSTPQRIPSEKTKLEEARIAKQNRDLDLKYAKERKELLSVESVQQVFSKLYSIQVSKLHCFSHIVTPDLAVIFKSTDNEKMIQTTELINNAMFTVLEEIKKAMNDYLLSVKAEEIEDESR